MGFGSLFKRDFINIILNPVLFFSNTVFPVLLLMVMGYLTHDGYGSAVSSYDYYGVTLLLYTVLNVSTTAANSFMEKSIMDSNLRILYSPVSTSFIYLSKVLATFVFTSLCYIAYAIIVKLLFNVNFGGAKAPYIFIMLLLFNMLSTLIGILFCCIFKSEESTNKILSIFINISAILGGTFFQIDGLGKTAQQVSNISPLKWITKAVFRTIYDGDTSLVLPVCAIFIAASLILLLGCKLTFKTEDYV